MPTTTTKPLADSILEKLAKPAPTVSTFFLGQLTQKLHQYMIDTSISMDNWLAGISARGAIREELITNVNALTTKMNNGQPLTSPPRFFLGNLDQLNEYAGSYLPNHDGLITPAARRDAICTGFALLKYHNLIYQTISYTIVMPELETQESYNYEYLLSRVNELSLHAAIASFITNLNYSIANRYAHQIQQQVELLEGLFDQHQQELDAIAASKKEIVHMYNKHGWS